MQLDELLDGDSPVSDERLAQELALIVARGDVREELDRLVAHVAAARELMAGGGAIGRRLDFLCCIQSRSEHIVFQIVDVELTRIVRHLKQQSNSCANKSRISRNSAWRIHLEGSNGAD